MSIRCRASNVLNRASRTPSAVVAARNLQVAAILAAFAAVAFTGEESRAQSTYTWTGSASIAWNTIAANWSGAGSVWVNNNNAVFGPTGSNRTIVPDATTNPTVRNLTVTGTGYSFTTNRINIGADSTWQVDQNVSMFGLGSGTFAITKTGTGTLTFTANGSAIAPGWSQTVGQTLIVEEGVASVAGRNMLGNFALKSGTLAASNDRFNMMGDGATLTITGGVLNATGALGLRLGNDAVSVGASVTGSMSGGVLNATSVSIGTAAAVANKVNAFTLTGGTMNGGGSFVLSSGTDAGSSATFSMSGGKLVVTATTQATAIRGIVAAPAVQVFDWTGGTIAAGAIDGGWLRSTAAGTSGTFANKGGTLAPGDVGVAGRTTVWGALSMSGSAVLAIDVGGTTQGTGWQGGDYDFVTTTGNTTVGGRLNVSLINGYTPPSDTSTKFSILTLSSGQTLSGSFANLVVAGSGNRRFVLADGLSSMLVATNTTSSAATVGGLSSVAARTVALGGYQATNAYTGAGTAWDAANAASWSNFDAGSTADPATVASTAIAQFADGPATTGAISIALNSTRNIRGITFASTATGANARAYTIAQGGSGAIVLDNTAVGTAAFITDTSASGNANAVNVPLTLASNLAVSVADAANVLTLGGVISGAARSLEKNGAGVLALSAANTYSGATTITAGQLRILAGNINASSGISLNGPTAELKYNSATALTAPLTFTQGTLSGTGTIGTAVTVATNDMISPGNSPGTQAFTSLHAWAPGGTYKWELNALTGTAGINWDLVDVTSGTFSLAALAATPGSQFILDLTTLAAGDAAGQLVNPYDGGSYMFAIASYNPANFLLPAGFSNTAGADLTSLFTFNSLANWQGAKPQVADISVKINSTATGIDLVIVPEPGALALAGIGVAAAAWAAHRRRRVSHTRGSSNPAR